jgi:hypothetical protein
MQDLRNNLHVNFPSATKRPYWKHGAGPDIMISLLTMKSYSTARYINKPLVFFRAHPDSFSTANTNNEVAEGYISAIAYYLANNEARSLWLNYVLRQWWANVKQKKQFLSPLKYFKAHEGSGSITELILAIIARLFRQRPAPAGQ